MMESAPVKGLRRDGANPPPTAGRQPGQGARGRGLAHAHRPPGRGRGAQAPRRRERPGAEQTTLALDRCAIMPSIKKVVTEMLNAFPNADRRVSAGACTPLRPLRKCQRAGRCCCSFGGFHCTVNGQLRVACCAGGGVLVLPGLCVEVFPAQIPGRIPSRIL